MRQNAIIKHTNCPLMLYNYCKSSKSPAAPSSFHPAAVSTLFPFPLPFSFKAERAILGFSLSSARSKLIISPHGDLGSSLRVSICALSPLPNFQLSMLQMHPADPFSPPVHPPSFHSQFHTANASDCHFNAPLITEAESEEWAVK